MNARIERPPLATVIVHARTAIEEAKVMADHPAGRRDAISQQLAYAISLLDVAAAALEAEWLAQ